MLRVAARSVGAPGGLDDVRLHPNLLPTAHWYRSCCPDNMMVLKTCGQCGIRFYAPAASEQSHCWRCERAVKTDEGDEVAERLLAEVFPDGLPSDS